MHGTLDKRKKGGQREQMQNQEKIPSKAVSWQGMEEGMDHLPSLVQVHRREKDEGERQQTTSLH